MRYDRSCGLSARYSLQRGRRRNCAGQRARTKVPGPLRISEPEARPDMRFGFPGYRGFTIATEVIITLYASGLYINEPDEIYEVHAIGNPENPKGERGRLRIRRKP